MLFRSLMSWDASKARISSKGVAVSVTLELSNYYIVETMISSIVTARCSAADR